MLRVENIPFQHALLPYWKEEIFGNRTASWKPRRLYVAAFVFSWRLDSECHQCSRSGSVHQVRHVSCSSFVNVLCAAYHAWRSVRICTESAVPETFKDVLQCQRLSRMCCRDSQGCAELSPRLPHLTYETLLYAQVAARRLIAPWTQKAAFWW
jgi:hypothetical protein